MGKVKVSAFTVSLDGFGAGPDQSLKSPMGKGAENLHRWMRGTRMFQKMVGGGEGTTGPDNDFAEGSMKNLGAWIMGRNMFTPERGPWKDKEWKGWWGANPPYHVPVFVLTHQARDPLPMEGGTTFYFVTDGIESALKKAKEAAKDKDIRIGGGASTIRQYLKADLIDEMHLVYSPVFLGQGENLLAGIDLPSKGFKEAERVMTEHAVHVVIKR